MSAVGPKATSVPEHPPRAAMAELGGLSTAAGTVISSTIARDYPAKTGFARTEVLDVEHPQFRLDRLEG